MIDNRTAPYGAFALRATSGAFFLAHAGMKLFVFTPAGTVKFFESVGVPGPVAYVDIAVEIIGGIAMLLGVYARQAALVLSVILLGAIVTLHGANGFFFNNPNGGWEYLAFWIVALVAQALLGDGPYAVRGGSAKVATLNVRSA